MNKAPTRSLIQHSQGVVKRHGRFAILAVLYISSSVLIAADRPMTPLDVARERRVEEVVISPNGELVAYVLRVPREPWIASVEDDVESQEKDGPPWSELHVVDQNGASRPFVTGRVNVSEIAWTPDGRGISFLAKRQDDSTASVYVIPIDGGEARRRIAHPVDIESYSWAPDGARCAFLAKAKPKPSRKDLDKKGFTQEIFEEDSESTFVWISEPAAPLGKARKIELPGSVSSVRWSPAGARLALGLSPTSLTDDQMMNTRVRIVDVESGEVVGSLDNPGKLGSFAWNTDGSHVAMVAADDIHDPEAGRLLVAPAEGGLLRDLLPDYEGHVTAIAWQDAETIMYVTAEGVWSSFGKVKLDGSERKTIVAPGKFVLSDLSLTKDGLAGAFVGQSPFHPREVFLMKHGQKRPRRITDSNPWMKEVRFAPQEVITYKARDGLDIEGILIRPLDASPSEQYPLILAVHGGPEDHVSNGWLTAYSLPGQVAAARGFAVFYPNYRGSTGRGVAFSKMGQADYAGKEFDDLIDGVDYLVELGVVDKDRVGITGGSYGGYASAWGATMASDRFAASVMFVGISDLISKSGTTDIPKEMNLVHARKWPWDDWAWFRDRSPLSHVQKGRTPILILAGTEDRRLDSSQSLMLYRYLKLLNQTPVRFVRYPGEGHGNRRAGSRLDYQLRMLQWMEHYLKGPGGPPPPYELDYEAALKPAAPTSQTTTTMPAEPTSQPAAPASQPLEPASRTSDPATQPSEEAPAASRAEPPTDASEPADEPPPESQPTDNEPEDDEPSDNSPVP